MDVQVIWETLKLDIKIKTQQFTKFHRRQHKSELSSLQRLLCAVNCRIYQGEDLHCDASRLQNYIKQCESQIWERQQDHQVWACKEGTMDLHFLHLEHDYNQNLDIKALLDVHGDTVSGDDVLTVLHDFYTDLYSNHNVNLVSNIEDFLAKLSLPQAEKDIDGGEISKQEILNAIAKLKTGKGLGTDGLTAAFYKKNCYIILAPCLAKCFNQALITGQLTTIQQLVIIMLLYKKGNVLEAGNYRPISLMNVDYKILAHVLVGCMQPFLDDFIQPAQTAYMLGRYIGTNIRKIQDVMDYA